MERLFDIGDSRVPEEPPHQAAIHLDLRVASCGRFA
jgi:hypothetical protein